MENCSFSHHYQGGVDLNCLITVRVTPRLKRSALISLGMFFLIHPKGWIDAERMLVHCLESRYIGLYILYTGCFFSLGLPLKCPSTEKCKKTPCISFHLKISLSPQDSIGLRYIFRLSGFYNPILIHPSIEGGPPLGSLLCTHIHCINLKPTCKTTFENMWADFSIFGRYVFQYVQGFLFVYFPPKN